MCSLRCFEDDYFVSLCCLKFWRYVVKIIKLIKIGRCAELIRKTRKNDNEDRGKEEGAKKAEINILIRH